MKYNIYDLTISELILRVDSSTAASVGAPAITITNSTNSNQVQAGFNGNMLFTSTISNIPTGYSISGVTHAITYPTVTPDTTGSTISLTGPSVNVILGAVGSTFVVTSAVTLIHATDPNIVLAGTHTVTAVLPLYYGVKPYEAVPTNTSLSQTASSATQFTMTSSAVGRMFVVIDTSITTPLVSVTGPNGLIYTVANDFTLTLSGSYNFYQLNYDTQLTGANIKTFTLNY
tara:strand:- start:89 stop:778 length:690 start_codon:yes stop_codon:yes gene_type:complete